MNEPQNLAVEWVPRTHLRLNPRNPRVNDAAVPHVAASIRGFGWRQPLVVQRTGELIAGNTRLKAAEVLGAETVPVVWFDGDDLEAKAYGVADNKTAEFASWDLASLAEILEELRQEDALEGVGFGEADLEELLADLERADAPEVKDPGPGEPPETPVTRPGDLWCGSSASTGSCVATRAAPRT